MDGLVPIQHQQESPIWGAGKKETSQCKQPDTAGLRNSSIVLQLNYEAAGL